MSNGGSGASGQQQSNAVKGAASTAGEAIKAFGEQLTKATTQTSTADPRVSAALALGWQMAEMYRDATRQPTGKPKLPQTLPTIHEVSSGRRTEFTIAEIKSTLGRLSLPEAGTAVEALEATFKNPETDAEDVKRAVYSLHMAILRECHADDRALGRAYELGRALADICPQEIDRKAMAKQLNRYRLDELGRWLADLATRLPDHSSRAVRISMSRWKIAAYEGESSKIFTKEDAGTVHRALDRQVQIWRSLLTGEKQAKEMLDTEGFARAVSFAVSDTRRLIFGYVWRFLPFVLVTLAILGAGIWGVTTYEATSKVIASLTAIVGALGLSWKGIASTLGRVAGEIEEPIWQGSIDLVVADAITQAPARRTALIVAARTSPAAGGSADTHGLPGLRVGHALPPGSDSEARQLQGQEGGSEDQQAAGG
jgi:hypothetical protein